MKVNRKNIKLEVKGGGKIKTDVNGQKLTKSSKEKYYEKGCVICLDSFKKDEKISKLECNHVYHTECIKLWFTNNLSCPMCRRIII